MSNNPKVICLVKQETITHPYSYRAMVVVAESCGKAMLLDPSDKPGQWSKEGASAQVIGFASGDCPDEIVLRAQNVPQRLATPQEVGEMSLTNLINAAKAEDSGRAGRLAAIVNAAYERGKQDGTNEILNKRPNRVQLYLEDNSLECMGDFDRLVQDYHPMTQEEIDTLLDEMKDWAQEQVS